MKPNPFQFADVNDKKNYILGFLMELKTKKLYSWLCNGIKNDFLQPGRNLFSRKRTQRFLTKPILHAVKF
jgi:hypothetical protein